MKKYSIALVAILGLLVLQAVEGALRRSSHHQMGFDQPTVACTQSLGLTGRDVAVGADGSVWAIGFNKAALDAYEIYNLNKLTGKWDLIPGAAQRLAVGPNGNPYVLNNGGIYTYSAGAWRTITGAAMDITVGVDGTVWVIGTNQNIYKLTSFDGSSWGTIYGQGVRIAVDLEGKPWVISAAGGIYKNDGTNWTTIQGYGVDVAVGANGDVYVSGGNLGLNGYQIFKWDPATNTFKVIPDAEGRELGVGPDGSVYTVDVYGKVKKITFQSTCDTTTQSSPSVPFVPPPTKVQQFVGAGAVDNAIGADGTLWVLNNVKEPGGYGIFRWKKATSSWEKIPGGATRIAVAPEGFAWLINENGMIFRYNGVTWVQMFGTGWDIAAGPDGSVWLIGNGDGIFKLNPDRRTWTQVPGSAYKVSVDSQGRPWVINRSGDIYRYGGIDWSHIPGKARDVSAGPNGDVYIVTNTSKTGGYQIHKWDEGNSAWVDTGLAGTGVAVGPSGELNLIDSAGSVYSVVYTTASPIPFNPPRVEQFTAAAVGSDVGFGKEGSMWALGNVAEGDGKTIHRFNKVTNVWDKIPGGANRISVGPAGNAWITTLTQNLIYAWNGASWVSIPGKALDIGVGADGTVCVIGIDNGIYKLRADRQSWDTIPGKGYRIAVDPKGNPWITNVAGDIFKWTGTTWIQLPGKAQDITVSPEGRVYVTAGDANSAGLDIRRWDETIQNWRVLPVTGLTAVWVAAGPNGVILTSNVMTPPNYTAFKVIDV